MPRTPFQRHFVACSDFVRGVVLLKIADAILLKSGGNRFNGMFCPGILIVIDHAKRLPDDIIGLVDVTTHITILVELNKPLPVFGVGEVLK